MNLWFPFALTMDEMGLSPIALIVIIIASSVFIVGFIKSSRENEYKKLMDYYTDQKPQQK